MHSIWASRNAYHPITETLPSVTYLVWALEASGDWNECCDVKNTSFYRSVRLAYLLPIVSSIAQINKHPVFRLSVRFLRSKLIFTASRSINSVLCKHSVAANTSPLTYHYSWSRHYLDRFLFTWEIPLKVHSWHILSINRRLSKDRMSMSEVWCMTVPYQNSTNHVHFDELLLLKRDELGLLSLRPKHVGKREFNQLWSL